MDSLNTALGSQKMIELAAERERIALLVEQMGMFGYGTLAIAAAIRSGTKASELDDISSPADRRKLANRPWSAP
jgi:hypothetical protein